MPEQMKSIAEARQNLSTLSKDAQGNMDRFVITNQGKPQSVLVGYDDYQAMRAAIELLQRPEALEDLRIGLAQHRQGEGLTATQVKELLATESLKTQALTNQAFKTGKAVDFFRRADPRQRAIATRSAPAGINKKGSPGRFKPARQLEKA